MKYNVAFKHGAASELNTATEDLVFVKNEGTNLYERIFQVSDMCRVWLSNDCAQLISPETETDVP